MSGIFAGRMDRTLWKGGWRDVGGFKKYYRSRWEANYARYLQYQKDQGLVISWAHEPKTFWFEGIKRGVNNYLPDFQVIYPADENGPREEYHEVKGWMDSKSATKIKRMAKYHPTVKLVVVDRKIYNNLEKQFGGVIEGWEFLDRKVEKEVVTNSVRQHKIKDPNVTGVEWHSKDQKAAIVVNVIDPNCAFRGEFSLPDKIQLESGEISVELKACSSRVKKTRRVPKAVEKQLE